MTSRTYKIIDLALLALFGAFGDFGAFLALLEFLAILAPLAKFCHFLCEKKVMRGHFVPSLARKCCWEAFQEKQDRHLYGIL